ncbi:hypothetical protein [Photorhabdus namnaonensis]|uniref:Uncharacterized protein n=1 Tax=Photorhabdus namnaonensis TaxID=1851568 RepID=A0A1B8YJF4_9GAMM|nr:hypothetical protein [Photorhabdus namnaonensis]OCA55243.1 hypothetical protein Phpb_01864 [Photorhabdus namnaonensis]
MFKINENTLSIDPVELYGMKLKFENGSVNTGIIGPEGQIGVRYSLNFKLILDYKSFKEVIQEKLPDFFSSFSNNVRPVLDGFAYYNGNFLIGNANFLKEKKDLHNFLINSSSWITGWSDAVGTGYLINYEKPVFSPSSDGSELNISAAKSFVFSDVSKIFEVKDIPVTALNWTLYLRDEIEDDNEGGDLNLAYYPDEIVYVDGSRLYKNQLYISGKYLTPGDISHDQIKVAK